MQEWIPTFKSFTQRNVPFFFFFFSFPLDTYRENEEFDRESSHCLPLDFRLLAVDGSGCFCEAGVAEW